MDSDDLGPAAGIIGWGAVMACFWTVLTLLAVWTL